MRRSHSADSVTAATPLGAISIAFEYDEDEGTPEGSLGSPFSKQSHSFSSAQLPEDAETPAVGAFPASQSFTMGPGVRPRAGGGRGRGG